MKKPLLLFAALLATTTLATESPDEMWSRFRSHHRAAQEARKLALEATSASVRKDNCEKAQTHYRAAREVLSELMKAHYGSSSSQLSKPYMMCLYYLGIVRYRAGDQLVECRKPLQLILAHPERLTKWPEGKGDKTYKQRSEEWLPFLADPPTTKLVRDSGNRQERRDGGGGGSIPPPYGYVPMTTSIVRLGTVVGGSTEYRRQDFIYRERIEAPPTHLKSATDPYGFLDVRYGGLSCFPQMNIALDPEKGLTKEFVMSRDFVVPLQGIVLRRELYPVIMPVSDAKIDYQNQWRLCRPTFSVWAGP
jgi:hypothetical protein